MLSEHTNSPRCKKMCLLPSAQTSSPTEQLHPREKTWNCVRLEKWEEGERGKGTMASQPEGFGNCVALFGHAFGDQFFYSYISSTVRTEVRFCCSDCDKKSKTPFLTPYSLVGLCSSFPPPPPRSTYPFWTSEWGGDGALLFPHSEFK